MCLVLLLAAPVCCSFTAKYHSKLGSPKRLISHGGDIYSKCAMGKEICGLEWGVVSQKVGYCIAKSCIHTHMAMSRSLTLRRVADVSACFTSFQLLPVQELFSLNDLCLWPVTTSVYVYMQMPLLCNSTCDGNLFTSVHVTATVKHRCMWLQPLNITACDCSLQAALHLTVKLPLGTAGWALGKTNRQPQNFSVAKVAWTIFATRTVVEPHFLKVCGCPQH